MGVPHSKSATAVKGQEACCSMTSNQIANFILQVNRCYVLSVLVCHQHFVASGAQAGKSTWIAVNGPAESETAVFFDDLLQLAS